MQDDFFHIYQELLLQATVMQTSMTFALTI